MKLTRFSTISLLAWIHLAAHSIALGRQHPQQQEIDFNALLDGSLGYMPALWLVSQGIMSELNSTSDSPKLDPSTFLSSSTHSANFNRTDKEEGAALAAFIGSILVPTVSNVADDGWAVGICKSLVSGATGMAGTVVSQEAGKGIYHQNSTEPKFEQGVIPGAFIGSTVSNGLNAVLSKSLCKKAVPNIGDWWEGAKPGRMKKIWNSLNQGFREVLNGPLRNRGVNPARASQFSSQLDDTLRLAQRAGLGNAFDHLNREFLNNAANLGRAAARNPTADMPALNNFARLGSQSLSNLNLPGGSRISGSSGPVGQLQNLLGSHAQALNAAGSVPALSDAANRLAPAVNNLQNAAMSASDALQRGLPEQAASQLNSAADAVSGLMDSFPPFDPFPGSGGNGDDGSGNNSDDAPDNNSDSVSEDEPRETETTTATVTSTRTVRIGKGPRRTVTATVTLNRIIQGDNSPAETLTVLRTTTATRKTTATETITTTQPTTTTQTSTETETLTYTVTETATIVAHTDPWPDSSPDRPPTWTATVDVSCEDAKKLEDGDWYEKDLAIKCTSGQNPAVLVRLREGRLVVPCRMHGYQNLALDWVAGNFNAQCSG